MDWPSVLECQHQIVGIAKKVKLCETKIVEIFHHSK
jgi:hypothetical protein